MKKKIILLSIIAVITAIISVLFFTKRIIVIFPKKNKQIDYNFDYFSNGTLFLLEDWEKYSKKITVQKQPEIEEMIKKIISEWSRWVFYEKQITIPNIPLTIGVGESLVVIRGDIFTKEISETIVKEWEIVKSLLLTIHAFFPKITMLYFIFTEFTSKISMKKNLFLSIDMINEEYATTEGYDGQISTVKDRFVIIPYIENDLGNELFSTYEKHFFQKFKKNDHIFIPKVSAEKKDQWAREIISNISLEKVILFFTLKRGNENKIHCIASLLSGESNDQIMLSTYDTSSLYRVINKSDQKINTKQHFSFLKNIITKGKSEKIISKNLFYAIPLNIFSLFKNEIILVECIVKDTDFLTFINSCLDIEIN